MKDSPTTIAEIARVAGVSKAAVSLALNDKRGVSEPTRQRILKIAEEAGYSLKKGAARLSTPAGGGGRLMFVACCSSGVVPSDYNEAPFFSELVHYFQEKCSAMGYTLTYVATGADDVLQRIDDAFAYDHAAGVVLLGTDLEESIIERIHRTYDRLVIVDTWFPLITGTEFVVMNNFAGGAAAADHLISLGHSNLGYVQSDVRVHNFDERRQGFFQALGKHGVPQKGVKTYTVTSNVAKAEEQFASLLSSPETGLPTAVFCESDYIAIGVLRALKKSGKRVPAEVSIIGFDDISQAQIVLPELTTVHVDKQSMAAIALERLEDIVSGRATTTRKTIVDTYLVTRQSCTAVKPESDCEVNDNGRTAAAIEE